MTAPKKGRKLWRAVVVVSVLGVAGLVWMQSTAAGTTDATPTPTPQTTPTAVKPGSTTPKTTQPPDSAQPTTPGEAKDDKTIDRLPYPGDPEAEAAYVADEDRRLVEVRTVDSLARWSKTSLNSPYRIATGSAYTLVLTPRREVYTIKDLLGLAPQTFIRQPDGGYLLSEHVVIQNGATLNLASSGGLTLRLASDGNGFVSIVNYGGVLNVQGANGRPVRISSWNRDNDGPDTLTNDGRSYIRSLGGQVRFRYAELSDLGFWSGRTGGLSLTGTDRPNSGSLDKLGETMRVGKRATKERQAQNDAKKTETNGTTGLAGAGKNSLSQVLPAGKLPLPEVDIADPEYSYVSALIQNTTVKRNAFGLFAASANGLDIRESKFDDSLVDGLVMHRYVTNAVVDSSTADGNAGDGFVLSRATTGIVLSEIGASRNHRNGLTMSGLPLADGPSATGSSLGSYGNNTVSNSKLIDNARYGVEVIGGTNIGVNANDLQGNDMGVVVRGGAEDVSVVGNRVTKPIRQGIAIRDGVSKSVITGNIVSGGNTSVYVRDSAATVQRNTLSDADSHAISLVGSVNETKVTENTISGRGPSAIDTKRAADVNMQRWKNDEDHWHDTTPFVVTLKRFLQPLTAMWLLLAALLIFTAARGTRQARRVAHPYADKAPVTDGRTLSAGTVPASNENHLGAR
ncbi:right-handed parallel beta-helix repeat-containing protein [Kribbella sp. CA-293567]|uniref:right-handed parallel beta-helix repeat-containing protein n=1 Tax=Kribbella sp. CA-293567 TaxID=3002436 RepID=UPI0022DDC469|nr:right-handed parallel beta-helix repeat-containing protein [Kribbella sp. CA-293567]WBQ04592.1 right-handed parallel beta-helix repeat-containing protein [Kribbella sp. CA-293567]